MKSDGLAIGDLSPYDANQNELFTSPSSLFHRIHRSVPAGRDLCLPGAGAAIRARQQPGMSQLRVGRGHGAASLRHVSGDDSMSDANRSRAEGRP